MTTHQAALLEKAAAEYDRITGSLEGCPGCDVDALEAAFAILGAEHGWQPIETAPKDGARIILAKIGRSTDPATWNALPSSVWWCVSGSWSNKWSKWWDGVEPCGLANSTHWMPLPAPPERKQKEQSQGVTTDDR